MDRADKSGVVIAIPILDANCFAWTQFIPDGDAIFVVKDVKYTGMVVFGIRLNGRVSRDEQDCLDKVGHHDNYEGQLEPANVRVVGGWRRESIDATGLDAMTSDIDIGYAT